MSEILGIDTDNYAVQKIKSTGGGSATLQSKSVTITENGTTNVNPDEGYDGLSSVAITTNVSGGADLSQYFNASISEGSNNHAGVLNFVKRIPANTVISGTSMLYAFYQCNGLVEIPLLDTSKVTNMGYMCTGCANLESFPALDTSKVISFYQTFFYCTKLKNVPVLDFSAMTNLNNTFGNCNNLTNDSLKNILTSLISATNYTGTKTLRYIGLTSTQATTCTTFSEWATLSAAGWTTGW